MKTALKRKYLGVLQKRIAHLTERITNSKKDLSWDKLEKAALTYSTELIEKEIINSNNQKTVEEETN